MKTISSIEFNGENIEELLIEQFKDSLNNNNIKHDDSLFINHGTLSMSSMNGHNQFNKFKSKSNHELGARSKLPGNSVGPRSISRYDSDTITTRYGTYSERSRSDNDGPNRIPIYGQPLNTSTKAFIEAANRKARMVSFFKNGQTFSRPIRMSIIPGKTFKSFHKLCDYLTTKSMIPLGVR